MSDRTNLLPDGCSFSASDFKCFIRIYRLSLEISVLSSQQSRLLDWVDQSNILYFLTVKFNRRHAQISSSVTSWIRLMTIAKLLDINMISAASQNLFALLTFSLWDFSGGFNVRDYSSIFEVKTKIIFTQDTHCESLTKRIKRVIFV